MPSWRLSLFYYSSPNLSTLESAHTRRFHSLMSNPHGGWGHLESTVMGPLVSFWRNAKETVTTTVIVTEVSFAGNKGPTKLCRGAKVGRMVTPQKQIIVLTSTSLNQQRTSQQEDLH